MLDDTRGGGATSCFSDKDRVLLATGHRVYRLVVQGLNRNDDVVCECDCGEIVAIERTDWLSGSRGQCQSCDDWAKASYVQQTICDPETYDALVSRGFGAMDRCRNPKNPNYPDYGGRDIQFLYESPEHFALHLWFLGWRAGDPRTTDRIDVNGNYEPNNVRLAMPKEQVRNRRISVVVDTGDEIIPLGDLAEQNGISTDSAEYQRLSAFVSQTKEQNRAIYDQIMTKISQLTNKPTRRFH